MAAELIYIADPMCSWCWAFAPVLAEVRASRSPEEAFRMVMGGLAPDSDAPMPEPMQQRLQATWQHIAEQTGTHFNFDFWSACKPRRSTYPACRAVLAAGEQGPAMFAAVQRAYYVEARNPSDDTTLIELAGEIGLDVDRFTGDLTSPAIQQKLDENLAEAATMGAGGFPTLILVASGQAYRITEGYMPVEAVQKRLETLLA